MRGRWISLFVLLLVSSLGRSAHADVVDLVCSAVKVTPGYWGIRLIIEQARDDGFITSREGCLESGAILGDLIPTGTFATCVCRDVFPVATPKPLCQIAHNVCTYGSALPPDMAMRSDCTPTASMILASQVCEVDPYCCTMEWDAPCVQALTPIFWDNAGDYVQQSIQWRPDCQLNQSNFPRTPEGIALYFQQCPGGRMHPQSALASAVEAVNATATQYRNSDAVCLGGAPSPLSSVGEFVLGDFNFAGNDAAGDWDVGFHKAECAPGFAQMGLSAQFISGPANGVLCQIADANRFTGNHVAMLALPGDQRRAARAGDWDPGFYKLECGNNEYVYATSQHATQHHLHAVACAQSTALSNDGCRSATVGSGSGWDIGTATSECAPHEYIAGVSADPWTLAPHALLCCSR
jgi:hypothetical protein